MSGKSTQVILIGQAQRRYHKAAARRTHEESAECSRRQHARRLRSRYGLRVSYPFWTDAELADRREREIAVFVGRWDQVLGSRYRELYEAAVGEVWELFRCSDDLRHLATDEDFLARRENRNLRAAARALAAPYLSEDNYKVIAKTLGPTRPIVAMLDTLRVPWMRPGHIGHPTTTEAADAVHSTAMQMALRRHETELRVGPAQDQEQQVRARLVGLGLTFVEPAAVRARLASRTGYDVAQGIEARNLDLALQPGEFTSEFLCAGTKCDIPIRTTAGRLFALECKVSNSSTNSTKRLIREVVGKEGTWRTAFGQDTLVGGYLAGVFSVKNLKDAQERSVLLFFDHDPKALDEFVRADYQPR